MRKYLYNLFAIVMCITLALAPSAALSFPAAALGLGTQTTSLQLVEKAYADTSPEFILDEYNVLSDRDIANWEAQAQEIAQKYKIGMYFVTVDNIGGKNVREFAKDYYVEHDLGVGSMSSGIMFLVAVESRDYVTIPFGDGHGSAEIGKAGGVDAFTDDFIDAMESDIVPKLSNSNWAGAADVYYDEATEAIEYLFEHGSPMKNSSKYHNGGGDDEELDGIMGWIIKILGILGFPAVVAGSVVSGEKKAMKNAEERYEADDYLDVRSLRLIKSNDQFINTTLAVLPLAQVEHDDDHDDGGRFGGGFGGFGHSLIDVGGFGGSSGGKF